MFWDAGAMLANLLALTHHANPRLLMAFVDAEVVRVLGLDDAREWPVALLAAGSDEPASGRTTLEPLQRGSGPLSRREQRFPEAEEAQAASSLETVEQVLSWRQQAQRFGVGSGRGEPPQPLEKVILRRGSARDFTLDPLESGELRAVLEWAARRFQATCRRCAPLSS